MCGDKHADGSGLLPEYLRLTLQSQGLTPTVFRRSPRRLHPRSRCRTDRAAICLEVVSAEGKERFVSDLVSGAPIPPRHSHSLSHGGPRARRRRPPRPPLRRHEAGPDRTKRPGRSRPVTGASLTARRRPRPPSVPFRSRGSRRTPARPPSGRREPAPPAPRLPCSPCCKEPAGSCRRRRRRERWRAGSSEARRLGSPARPPAPPRRGRPGRRPCHGPCLRRGRLAGSGSA